MCAYLDLLLRREEVTKEVKGVFVRLPLSEVAEELLVDAAAFGKPDDSHDKALLTIGTPVTGGVLKTMAHISRGGDRISLRRKTERDIPLVRQSDAQAKIAALEAEVVRLRETMKEIELGIDALSSEEDDGGRMTSSEMKRRALEVIRSEVKALKGGAA